MRPTAERKAEYIKRLAQIDKQKVNLLNKEHKIRIQLQRIEREEAQAQVAAEAVAQVPNV